MNISFDKIDCFTGIIEEVKNTLRSDENIMAIYAMQVKPEMREQFININNSNKSKECKQADRIMYLIDLWKPTNESAKRHGYNNVQALSESRLKQMFDEESFLKELLNVYYKAMVCISSYQLKTDYDVDIFIRDAEISLGTKIDKSDVVNVIQKNIPQIKDIEAEFLSNCPTLIDAEKICSFYHNRLLGHIDTNAINWFEQKVKDEHPNLKDLVLCGLLSEDSMRIIRACFIMLPAIAISLCNNVIDFLKKYSTVVQYQNGEYKADWVDINLNECIIKIYNECNGKQWESITIDQFINLLRSNGKHQSLIIKKAEINRTKCVFKKISNYIKDNDERKGWIGDIKKNIFNDVDFMKATPRTDKLSSGYSSIDSKFQEFINNL